VQKLFLYDPTLIHNTFVTDRRTDGQETDGNGTIDAYSIAVIKKARQNVYSIGLIINVRE